MSKKVFLIWIAFLASASVALRFLIGPNPLYGAAHDDQLMVQAAHYLSVGQWAGPYSVIGHLGLSKPLGYPLFLWAIRGIPLSPIDVAHIIFVGGMIFFLREMRSMSIPRSLLVILFGLFVFYPPLFNEPISRVYREGLLTALTIWIFAISLIFRRRILVYAEFRTRRNFLYLTNTALLLGSLIGYFVITKNTWHFIALLISLTILSTTRQILKFSRRFLHLVTLGLASVLAILLGITSIIAPIIMKNNQEYGVSLIDSYSYGAFPSALNSIYSVHDDQNRAYVDVTLAMRTEIYAVSPTFSLLKPYLELPESQGWRGSSCASAMAICDESAAWFPWDIRDAVQSAGLGTSASQFESTFKSISREIDTACQRKDLKCDQKGLAPGLDSLTSLSPRIVLNAFAYGVKELTNPISGLAPRTTNANITPEQAELWNNTINRLPSARITSNYEAQSFFLYDLRKLTSDIYQIFWWPLILLSVVGYLFGFNLRNKKVLIGLTLLLSMMLLIFEISLLEASSGVYMIPGAQLYEICLIPLMFAFITLGLSRWNEIFESMSGRTYAESEH